MTNIERTNTSSSTIYDIEINQLNGTPLRLSKFKGKFLLIVNVASKCGFTPQYKDLEQLYLTNKERLMVVGVPCNQFGSQEPGSALEIQNFCERNYGVSFGITEKIEVKGPQQHPLYQWLTQRDLNGVKNSTVRWNFQKYLISPTGQLIDFYYSVTSPMSKKITKRLI
ncbi:MAG: glutathione peroxidase [Bacteroidota bacterium]